jgi:ATP-dependent DNA helicase RecG
MTNAKKPSASNLDGDALIEEILLRDEDLHLDFKRAGKNDSAIETICAFANTEGGWVVLGVEDPEKAEGHDRLYGIEENPEAVDALRRLIGSRLVPTLDPAPTFRDVHCTLRSGSPGHVLLVRVPKSERVHSVVDRGVYVRLPKSNRRLWSAEEISDLSLRRGAMAFDAALVDVPLELLDTASWHQYASHRRLTRPLAEALYHVGLARKDDDGTLKPTRAAVLLFAEEPNGLLHSKCTIRLFHYKGTAPERTPSTNLVRPPRTLGGPLIAQIREAVRALKEELASGVQVSALGFEVVQRYPVRVLQEAITNAVLHRAYHVNADIHVRIFSDRVEIESPGALPHNVTLGNLREVGSKPRNALVVDHMREFPEPPNLDAGEGVRMMFETMHNAALYPPLYSAYPGIGREAVLVVLLNEVRPTAWDQVVACAEQRGNIGNAEVRAILGTEDPVRASKALKEWVSAGLLRVVDPASAKQHRRYALSEPDEELTLFSFAAGKQGDHDA